MKKITLIIITLLLMIPFSCIAERTSVAIFTYTFTASAVVNDLCGEYRPSDVMHGIEPNFICFYEGPTIGFEGDDLGIYYATCGLDDPYIALCFVAALEESGYANGTLVIGDDPIFSDYAEMIYDLTDHAKSGNPYTYDLDRYRYWIDDDLNGDPVLRARSIDE